MESLKEIFEALSQRIKSPIWGYVFLSFVGFNWKPLYFVIFSGEPALYKFKYFDSNTDFTSLLVWPLAVGLVAALAAPYISDLGTWWATSPTNRKRLREVSAAHKVLSEKNKLLADRENQRAIYEQVLIDRAKRDDELSEIKDDDRREEVQDKIAGLRNMGEGAVVAPVPVVKEGGTVRSAQNKTISNAKYFSLASLSDLSLDILKEMKARKHPVAIGSETGNSVIYIGKDVTDPSAWTTARGSNESDDLEFRKLAKQPITDLENREFVELVEGENNVWKITDLGLQYLNWLTQTKKT